MEIIVKVKINRILYEMLGKTEYVDMWWETPNQAFEGKTPNEIYYADATGRHRVANFVMKQYGGGW